MDIRWGLLYGPLSSQGCLIGRGVQPQQGAEKDLFFFCLILFSGGYIFKTSSGLEHL
jgi:hypothetical protein